MKPRILVVDDDEAITQQLYWTLAGEYDVVTAIDMSTAILPNSRVLIMSSNAELDVQKACHDAGADEFFDKPFEIQEMLSSICRLAPVHRLELIAQIL